MYNTQHAEKYLMKIALIGEQSARFLRSIAIENLKDELEVIEGVSEVRIGGGWNQSLDINIGLDRLSEYDVSSSNVSYNINLSFKIIFIGKYFTKKIFPILFIYNFFSF